MFPGSGAIPHFYFSLGIIWVFIKASAVSISVSFDHVATCHRETHEETRGPGAGSRWSLNPIFHCLNTLRVRASSLIWSRNILRRRVPPSNVISNHPHFSFLPKLHSKYSSLGDHPKIHPIQCLVKQQLSRVTTHFLKIILIKPITLNHQHYISGMGHAIIPKLQQCSPGHKKIFATSV